MAGHRNPVGWSSPIVSSSRDDAVHRYIDGCLGSSSSGLGLLGYLVSKGKEPPYQSSGNEAVLSALHVFPEQIHRPHYGVDERRRLSSDEY